MSGHAQCCMPTSTRYNAIGELVSAAIEVTFIKTANLLYQAPRDRQFKAPLYRAGGTVFATEAGRTREFIHRWASSFRLPLEEASGHAT